MSVMMDKLTQCHMLPTMKAVSSPKALTFPHPRQFHQQSKKLSITF
jgi:hypothetical protein